MSNFFCADNSQKQGEELIGTATNNQNYILVECPQPWMSSAFHSKWVPENLSVLVKECKSAKLPIRFLLIANNMSHKVDTTTLLIYERNKGLGSGYSKWEFKLENIEQAQIISHIQINFILTRCQQNPSLQQSPMPCGPREK